MSEQWLKKRLQLPLLHTRAISNSSENCAITVTDGGCMGFLIENSFLPPHNWALKFISCKSAQETPAPFILYTHGCGLHINIIYKRCKEQLNSQL